jgi:hypothetical protein
MINFSSSGGIWSTIPKCDLQGVLEYIRPASVASKCNDHYYSIMATVPNGTYNIINIATGRYANLAQGVVAPYTPVIAWGSSGSGGENEKVTFVLLAHFA